MTQILIPVTNSPRLGDSDDNGTYAPELTHALHVFLEAGYDFELVSIDGGAAPLYGLETEDEVHRAVLEDGTLVQKMSNTRAIEELESSDFGAVFYPGGFGLLNDLAENEQVAAVTARLYEAGAVVGAVCHGPAGLLPVKLSSGEDLLAGKTVTGFTCKEETEFGTLDQVPFLLEEALLDKACAFQEVEPWAENVLVDERLVTGQNPASAAGVARAMVELLGR